MAAKKVYFPIIPWSKAEAIKYIRGISDETNMWDTNRVLRFGVCGADDELLLPQHMVGLSTKVGGPGLLELEVHCYSSIKSIKAAMKKDGWGDAPKVNYEAFSPTKKAATKKAGVKARGKVSVRYATKEGTAILLDRVLCDDFPLGGFFLARAMEFGLFKI